LVSRYEEKINLRGTERKRSKIFLLVFSNAIATRLKKGWCRGWKKKDQWLSTEKVPKVLVMRDITHKKEFLLDGKVN